VRADPALLRGAAVADLARYGVVIVGAVTPGGVVVGDPSTPNAYKASSATAATATMVATIVVEFRFVLATALLASLTVSRTPSLIVSLVSVILEFL
jgi:hypothetical protein